MVNNEVVHEAYTFDLKIPKHVDVQAEASFTNSLKYKLIASLLAKKKNCKACGGLVPELAFIINKKTTYYCTIYQIEENGKVIQETDYERLCDYLRRRLKKK